MSSRIDRFSRRVARMRPSATARVFARVAELRARGVEVLSLSVGEPDFEPPPHVRQAVEAAIAHGGQRYTEVAGMRSLREAICADSQRRRGHAHRIEQVVVSAGAKHVLFNLAQVLLDEGDEVLIPTPSWGSYADQVRLCGGVARLIPCSEQTSFLVRPDALRAAIGPRTRALVLCSPSNPTGAAYDDDALRALAQVVAGRDIWVIVDEIYSTLTYEGFRQRSLLELAPELRDRLVIVDGVSKRFAMTGYRVGWMLGPTPLARACEALQSQATTSVATLSQLAAQAALSAPTEPVEQMRAELERRRARMLELLADVAGIACFPPRGAFYVLADVRGLLGLSAPDGSAIADDVALASYLLDEAQVAVVPGTAFDAPGHLRFSYASSPVLLERAVERIKAALARLS